MVLGLVLSNLYCLSKGIFVQQTTRGFLFIQKNVVSKAYRCLLLCLLVILDITVKRTAQSVWSSLSSKAMIWRSASMARRNNCRPMGKTYFLLLFITPFPPFHHPLSFTSLSCIGCLAPFLYFVLMTNRIDM